MEINNLGKADGLPPADWAAVVERLDAGSAPVPDAMRGQPDHPAGSGTSLRLAPSRDYPPRHIATVRDPCQNGP